MESSYASFFDSQVPTVKIKEQVEDLDIPMQTEKNLHMPELGGKCARAERSNCKQSKVIAFLKTEDLLM